ncbi:hypothetical protein [Fluviispira multicolorata]|uniref:Uncharacterized protein n=1 Tax=Fluviispira multicolorata TaxID=2654512 RepID=A0A833JC67_9BACT|nr:hypothetical protein [Fluviispira multicolorata]KAB8029797.1 hypothetical protein GCL57_09660 [Fluviispira multicolorata]
MLSLEQDILVRDVILVFAAIIGAAFLLILNLRESGIRFKVFGENQHLDKSDLHAYDETHYSVTDWQSISVESYIIHFEEPHTVWQINMFTISMNQREKIFSRFSGFPWHEFSKSQSSTEKIMAPILRKIFLKYKSKFEKIHPIHVLRVPRESIHFYTWLQNETHTHSAIFNFLEESLYLSKQAEIFPSLSVVWDDTIYLEVIFPKNHLSSLFEQEFEKVFGIDCSSSESRVILKLWVAFSIEKIPQSLREKDKKKLKSYKATDRAS